MGIVADFFRWLYNLLLKGIGLLTTVGGQITAAIAGVVTFCGTIFSKFTWLDTAVQWVHSAQGQVHDLINSADAEVVQALFGWFAFDRLVQVMGTVIACTVGVVVTIFITCFVALFALVPLVLAVRAVLKFIRVGTGGVVDP